MRFIVRSLFNSTQTLKAGQHFDRQVVLDRCKQFCFKMQPSHWGRLLKQCLLKRQRYLKKEWRTFAEEIHVLSLRIHEIRNQTKMQKLVGMLSPFDSEKKTILAASIVINLLALAFPLLMLQLYDRILPHQSMDTLGLFAIAVGLAVALESITRVARAYTTAWVSARFEHKAMMEVAERILVEPLHEFERLGTGAVMENFKSISSLKYHYSGQTYQQLMDLPFTLFYLLIIYILNIWIGVLVTVGYAAFVFIAWKMGRNDPILIKQQKMADLRRSNFLNETLNNVHTMKSMSMESLMLRRYERLQESAARIMARMTYSSDMTSGIGNVFSPLMTTLVVALGAYLVITHHLTNGELAACVLLGMRSLAPLQRLGGIWTKFQQDEVLRDGLAKTLVKPGFPASTSFNIGEGEDTFVNDVTPASLELRDVSYRFPSTRNQIFDHLNLTIHAGECVAISGDTGAGRSTLLKLMAGVLTPTDGQVLINGKNILDIDLRKITEQVAYLPQHSQMFEGSLLDNVSVFDANRVERALSTANSLGLADFVSRMPRGWDSPVGDMATDSLPPGYRQRIAIVRALSNHPNIILMDDPTSTMDLEGDAVFLRFLEAIKGKVTLVIVSQRPSYLRLADKTFFLNAGCLTETPVANILSSSESILQNPMDSRDLVTGFAGSNSSGRLYQPIPSAEFFNSPLKRGHVDTQRWARTSETVNSNFNNQTDLSSCLTLLLKLLNSRGSARDVAESLPYFTESLDLPGFNNTMAQLGYKVMQVRCALGDLDPRSLPCLFLPNDGFGFIAMGRVGQHIRRSDGESAEVDLEPNLGMIGQALFYELVDAKTADNQSWVFKVMLRFAPIIGQATISALVTGLVIMAGPLFMMVVYSTIIPSGAKDTLLYLGIGSVLALSQAFFFMRQRARILSYIAGRIEYLFGATILQQVLRMSPAYTERASVGSQTSRLQSFEAIRDLFIGPLASTVLESPATLILLIALSIINPIALLVFVMMTAIYCFLYWMFSVPTKERVAAVSKETTKRNEFLVEMISKMRVVRECGAQALWLERFRDISASATMASFRAEQMSSLLVGVSYFVMMLSALLIVTTTVPSVLVQTVSSGALIASLMLMWRVLTPIQTAFTNMTRIERVRSATRQIDGLMKIQGESQGAAGSPVAKGVEGSVEFARVSFRYSLNVDPALIGMDFKVSPGDMVAISGSNGGGKSTILKLILGMYQPQAGAILIDNVDIRQLDPIELRRLIGYAPQDIQLFRATIAQNLRLARPDATDDEIYQSLDMAGALEQVLALPKGLECRVGDNTNELPSSLKQQISLARAYLTRAPIMLFDEPGAGLDEAADHKLVETLKALKGKVTVIFISHRPSHIRLADILLVLDKGYLRAAGPPSELLKQPVTAAVSVRANNV
ncbi:peptidase domain-containing ABC transporter [Polynucleobacter sp.]|uniref:peptidase domain-containing ABC transporter n=1 Tax=Polynucleobacter sp. TaxID=2029855 RepID=UPI00272B8AEF|nr:ATP-binding cassette domain-containing protein [Polynucleobacter sp.]